MNVGDVKRADSGRVAYGVDKGEKEQRTWCSTSVAAPSYVSLGRSVGVVVESGATSGDNHLGGGRLGTTASSRLAWLTSFRVKGTSGPAT